MNAHQRRLSRQQRRRAEAQRLERLRRARNRDVDADMPHYVRRDLGRTDGDLRVDRMPDVVRGHRRE